VLVENALRHGAGAIRVERDQADATAAERGVVERELDGAGGLAGAGGTDEGDDEGAESGERRASRVEEIACSANHRSTPRTYVSSRRRRFS